MAKKTTPVMLDRMRKAKCASCGSSFRTFEADRTVCQNCDGTAGSSGSAKDGEIIRKANASAKSAPQSVNPRTGLPTETPATQEAPADAG